MLLPMQLRLPRHLHNNNCVGLNQLPRDYCIPIERRIAPFDFGVPNGFPFQRHFSVINFNGGRMQDGPSF